MECKLLMPPDVAWMKDTLLAEPLNLEGIVQVMQKLKDHVLTNGKFESDLQPVILLDRCNKQLNKALGQYVFAKDGVYMGNGDGAISHQAIQLALRPLLRARAIRIAKGNRWGKTFYYAGAALRWLGDMEYNIPRDLHADFYKQVFEFNIRDRGMALDYTWSGETAWTLPAYEARYDEHRKLIKVVRL